MTDEHAIKLILSEVKRARSLHPRWPKDGIHQAAIVAEEAGELVQAAINHRYAKAGKYPIEKEAIHTAATAIRLLTGK